MSKNLNELQQYLNLSDMMILATKDESGNPYTANVYFGYDNMACYFISRPTRLHCQYIEKDENIAWSVINTEKFKPSDNDKKGLQFQGVCHLLDEDEGNTIYTTIYQPQVGFGSEIPQGHRVYRCIPKSVRIWDESLYGGDGKIVQF